MHERDFDEPNQAFVWLFQAVPGAGAGGVFRSLESASAWILRHRLTGLLTQYPLDYGVFDYIVEKGWIKRTKPHLDTPEFMGGYCGNLHHYHCEDGQLS